MMKKSLIAFIMTLAIICLFLSGCILERDENPHESSTQSSCENISSKNSQSEGNDPPVIDNQRAYYMADVYVSKSILALPYAQGTPEYDDIYYSAISPGGEPKKDGTGKIWLTLTPLDDKCVDNISIEGEYSHIEALDNDIYCIHGVKSDLTVNVTERKLPNAYREIFDSYGYEISKSGTISISWVENPADPIRYVEASYNDGINDHTEYIDASNGLKELFVMTENRPYTVYLCAIGYKSRGDTVKLQACYVSAPKEIPFPRVEITTENYVLPSCDFVSSPDGCWGAGITNAEYEQCVITLYNEKNEIVYASSTKEDSSKFTGAKMKIRGNTSARYATNGRFPFKIKLNKKADLLSPFIDRGEKEGYEDKDWLLLNYGNEGFRIFGDAIADAVGTEWSPDYCYVSLYVNGEYKGLYVLSESVKEGNGEGQDQWRVGVDSDGYVFECDAYWWNEDLSFSTPLTENTPMHFTFKYPDSDILNTESEELLYLQEYLTKFEQALMKNDDSYLDYIDLDSFVKWLLVSDFLCINDGGGCNIFLYKRDSTNNSKIAMGPNWDFDSYMGNVYGLSTIRLKWNGAPFYYQYLIEKESFQKRYKELFWELKDTLEDSIEDAFAQIDVEAHTSLLRYDSMCFDTSEKTLREQKDKFIYWLEEHIRWMEEQFK